MAVVTLGETMVLFIPDSSGPLRFAGHFAKSIGGAESAVAIGLARLGHNCGWISRLGNDEFGIYVRNFVRGEGVDTSKVIWDDNHPTGLFFKERQAVEGESRVYYYRSTSAASRLSPEDLDEEYIAGFKFLHITGITPALSLSCRDTVYRAVEIARKHNLTVVFDPNIRLKLWSEKEATEVLRDLVTKCDIVMPGLEEGQILTGAESPEKIAQQLLQLGPQAIIVKLGDKGAYYKAGTEEGYVDAVPVKQVVDPIGAGDAFAAGFLSGLLRGFSYKSSVALANKVASFALTVAGDIEALPTWSQVNRSNHAKDILR